MLQANCINSFVCIKNQLRTRKGKNCSFCAFNKTNSVTRNTQKNRLWWNNDSQRLSIKINQVQRIDYVCRCSIFPHSLPNTIEQKKKKRRKKRKTKRKNEKWKQKRNKKKKNVKTRTFSWVSHKCQHMPCLRICVCVWVIGTLCRKWSYIFFIY